MAGEARESRLAIVIDSGDAEQRIKELRKQLRELGQQSDETGDNTDDLGRRQRRASDDAGNLGSANDRARKSLDNMAIAAAAAGIALAGAIGLSINKAQSWETAMAEINKTVNFAADDGLANLRKGLQELTTQIPQTFEELAAVTATGGQLGIAEKDLLRFTEVMAKMGVAFDIPAQQAADSMAKIANVFQIPIANIDRLGDAINTLSNNTPATAAQLIDSLQRVGGVAKVFGLSEDATLGLTGALIAMGKPAEVASTAVNSLLTTFSTLDNATKSQRIGFEQLGLDIDEFSQLVKTDGKQAIVTYLEAINDLEQSERIGTNAMIVGKEFGDDITMLASSIGVLEKNWAMLGETAGTTKEYFGSMDSEFVKISATSANKMQLFKNNIDGVVAGIGGAFIPALNDLLFNMTPLIATLSIWVSENPELIQQIVVIGGAFLGAVVGLKLLVDGFMAAKATIEGLKLAFSAAKAGIAILTGSMGIPLLVIGALIVAGVLLYQHWDLVKEKASQLASWLDGVFSGLPAPVQAALSTMATIVSSSMDAIFAVVQFAMDSVTAIWNGDWSALGGIAKTALSAIWSSISTILGSVLNTVKVILGSLWGVFSSILSSIWQGVVSRFNDMVSSASSALSNMVSAARAKMTEVKNAIVNTLKELPSRMLSIGREIIQGLINGIKSGASGVASAIGNVASSAIAKAKSVLDIHSPSRKMAKIGEQTAQGMAVGIKKGKKAVVSEAQKMAADAIKATQDAIAGIDKELALFGNTSKVADIKYDISIGKFGGNTGALLAKATELESVKKMADIQSQLVAYSKMIYDNSTYLPSELTKISYELDEVEGKFYGASEASKELLRTGAALADQSKAEGVATGMMIDNLRELALLQTDGSDYAKLAYDLQDVSNALYVLDDATKQRLLTDELAIKAAKQTKESNDAITTSIESLDKQIALFGNNDAVEELLYDMVELGKYAGASADKVDRLLEATGKLAALNAEKAFKGVLDENAGDKSPIGKIMQEYDEKLAIIKAYEDSHTALLQESVAARLEVEGAYNDARSIMMLSSGEAVFGSLSGLAKNFLGEQSGTYKAMYALQKAFTLSSAIMSSKKAVMDAWANTPGGVWAKAFAAGKVILSTGAITKAIAGLAPQGFKSGGYTGSMGVNDVAGVVHGQEYVFDAQATKRIGVDNLNAMRRGEAPKGGGSPNVIIHNNAPATEITTSTNDNGELELTIERISEKVNKRNWSQLQNPNSHPSKMVKQSIQAPRRR